MSKSTPRGLYLPDGTVHRFAEGSAHKGLADHIATRGRSPDFTALGMYLPNPDPILKKMGKDAAVYRDLKSDAHVGGSVRRRKAAVKAMEWRVVDSVNVQGGSRAGMKASPRAMSLAYDLLVDLDLDALLSEMLEAPLFGWQPMEVLWRRAPWAGGAWLPEAVQAKPQEWFHFDPEGMLRFRSRAHPMYGEELQPRKFLVPRQDATYANPYGTADLSMCFWPTTFKRGGLKFWVTFAEKFGMPWVVGKQPRNAGGKETDDLLDQLEAMVQDAVAVIPDDSSVDIKESSSKGDVAGAYEALLMFCRSEVSIALLGQNQTTEANSNRASATAGLEVTQDLRDGDARLVEGAVNQLLRWVTDLNESEDAPSPRFELFEQEEVSEVQAKRDGELSRAGVRFTAAYWRRSYGLEDGDIEEDSADPPPPALPTGAPAPAPDGEGSTGDPLPEYAERQVAQRDAIDDLVDQELEGWQAVMEPLVDPLQALLDEAVTKGWTAAELLERLPAVAADMDASALAERLARTTLAARLAAGAGVPTDDAKA